MCMGLVLRCCPPSRCSFSTAVATTVLYTCTWAEMYPDTVHVLPKHPVPPGTSYTTRKTGKPGDSGEKWGETGENVQGDGGKRWIIREVLLKCHVHP